MTLEEENKKLKERVILLEQELKRISDCYCPRCKLNWGEPTLLDDEEA